MPERRDRGVVIEFAKRPAECNVFLEGQFLSAKQQHNVFVPRLTQRPRRLRRDRSLQVEPDDLRAERGGQWYELKS